MHSPYFSVVIPTHNRSSLLKRAVFSVLNQTFKNIEILVVDDNSTDDTPTMVKSFTDDRFNYMLNQRGKGACGARNTGIFSAKGKWVAFLDDDDTWFPNKLECQFEEILKSDDSVGLVCSDFLIYKGAGKKVKIRKNRPSGWVKNKILFGGCIKCLSTTCIRTDILIKIGGFDETFPSCQDQDLWTRVAQESAFTSVPRDLVLMYQERRPRIGQNNRNKLEGHIRLKNKYASVINKNIRLRHRHESTIFIYALLLKKRSITIKSMPWFFLGFFVDFPNFILTLRTALLLLHRFRNDIFNTSWN